MILQPTRSSTALVLLAMGLSLGQPLSAQTSAPDHAQLKNEMKVLEAVINQNMSQTFAPPFGLLEKTKGAYLPDFGLVFSLEVNLYPTRMPSPFDTRPLSQAEVETARKTKVGRIEAIKKSVPRLLADHAAALHDMSASETVAVVTHFFEVQTDGGLPSQLVIEVKKSDLDQYEDKKLSYEQLLGKMKIAEL
ncbi:MAG TPA: hypothetical protein VG204_19015 [Terriglobia bacterium]|nr:hypothetical protein [Terriglobia bacterium]